MDIQLIADYGVYFYLLIFVWTFFEGETIVLFAGFAAAQGLLDPLLLLICAGLGSYLGDQCYFWLGRKYGVRLLKRFPSWRPGVESALGWLERYDIWFILSFRFIYGVRNFSSFALGLSAVRWDRFLRLNFVAAMLWAASFVGIGYFLGHAFSAAVNVAHWLGYALLGIFVALAGGVWLMHRRHRRHARRVQSAKPVGVKPMLPPN
ncbi:MAG TPA: DedA family protein [Stellaceae bacterium]|nr:DedA family protein [Stellaceae bacterium]